MNIIESFSTRNDCYRKNVAQADSRYTTFHARGPIGLMLHSVACPQPSAKVFADGWNVSGKDVAVHAVLQADGTVYQCMPWNFRGWHAGGKANETHVGVEMTEPKCITYSNSGKFTVSDMAAARAHAEGCYKTAVDLFAMLCKEHHIDPTTGIISHSEGGKKGIASGHGDPEHLWKGLGMSYTMDTFRAAVKAKMADSANRPNNETTHPDKETEENEMMTRDQILAAMGDQYITTFEELPEWAKPEVRELLDKGYINGGTTEDIDPDDINMPLSDIRACMVMYRAMKGEAPDLTDDALRERMRPILEALRA